MVVSPPIEASGVRYTLNCVWEEKLDYSFNRIVTGQVRSLISLSDNFDSSYSWFCPLQLSQ